MTDTFFDQQHGYYLEELSVGMNAVYAKTMTEADIAMFAAASGDMNPLHINKAFAAKTRFNRRLVHGMLTTSLWSAIIGTKLPGPGCIYMKQSLKFIKPVFIGDTVAATMEIVKIDPDKQRVYLDGECRVLESVVAVGQGVVWVPRKNPSSP